MSRSVGDQEIVHEAQRLNEWIAMRVYGNGGVNMEKVWLKWSGQRKATGSWEREHWRTTRKL